MAAAAAGKMILCEKPLAMSDAEGEQMCEAAEKAGILEEDVLIALDDQAVPNVVTLERLLIGHFQVGQTIVVTVLRGDERRMLSLTLGENPG